MPDNSPVSFATADDGCRIAIRTLRTGADQVPPVIAIHALAMDGTMWADVASSLRTDATVLAIDCRGHGRSAKPRGPYTTSRFADDILSVMEHTGHSKAVFAGCSMGGTVALALAGKHAARVAGLALFNTTAFYGDQALANWSERAQTVLREGFSVLTAFQLERWFSPEFRAARPDIVTRAQNIFLANDTASYAESCLLLGHADERDGLGNYVGPAAVAVGENDVATTMSMAEEIKQYLPQARICVMPHVRHFTSFEVPEQVADQIDSVLREVSG